MGEGPDRDQVHTAVGQDGQVFQPHAAGYLHQGASFDDGYGLADLIHRHIVENDYIGSPCGKLDQIMILFAREGMGTHYIPATRSIEHIPLGVGASDFRIVSLDTGTERPGLEKSTYRVRRAECEELVGIAQPEFGIACLADVKDEVLCERIQAKFVEFKQGKVSLTAKPIKD